MYKLYRDILTKSLPAIPAEARIGHVHLKVADLDRPIRFYHELI